jgi:GT2 family glycosyltransferase
MSKIEGLPRVSVIIVNYNGLKDTLECLNSLKKCSYSNFEVIVVDNGSEGVQMDEMKGMSEASGGNVVFMGLDENYGFCKANNLAVERVLDMGESKYVYFLNNDTVVDPDFLTEAVKVLEDDDLAGIVASLSLQYDKRNLVENAGHYFLDCGDFVPRGRGVSKSKFTKNEEVAGACSAGALYRVKTLELCGLYSEEFFMNYEDADLSIRCILYGWKCVFVPKSIIYHKGGASIGKVRDYSFNLRSLENLLRAYFYNTPLLVLILNLPFFLLREISVVIVCTLFLRFKILKVFLHSRGRFLKNIKQIYRKRKSVMSHKKISSFKIWRMQKNFLSVYLEYFWLLMIKRQKSVLESKK